MWELCRPCGVYMRMRPRLYLVVCALVGITTLAAQEPAFDVASIRPTQSTANSEIRTMPNGRFTATNATARSLILRAYGLVDAQLIGAPGWLESERYDIDARPAAPPAGGPEAILPMLRMLIVERFKLKAHAETRELPAYALIYARRDQQLGPQIRPTQTDCTRPSALTADEVRASVRDGWPQCGMTYYVNFTTNTPAGSSVKMRVRRAGTTIPAFATSLQPMVDRPVIDQTGLQGLFDVEYSYAPQPPTPGVESAFGPDAPMVFIAHEEQLGLKLEGRRMPVPVLVIDSIDHPTEN